jgi:chromosome segregation protein
VRLNSIKLSGFKSFADPTHFLLPGQLVGVVGPNGCGKSNIMDAVRWVLGESRASELRGESMQDVIFNGTTSRKPASRASVELVFDNADHRAGGQWSQYAEVAVKRVLTRDGTSNYLLNNQPVRRRDVQDVFLGTGLGPRAYAIIGQGTISRIIESRPEELRMFLEEAAGVSKYKERRRETETRLADTRENLTRVEDILRELNANLQRLEKQAEVARQYRQLQADATLKQHQLWYHKRSDSEAEQNRLQAQANQALNALEAQIADLRHIEAEQATLRQAHYSAGDQVTQAQGLLYEASAEIGRLEAEIRYVQDSRQRVAQQLSQLQAQIALWATRRAEAEAEHARLTEQSQAVQERAQTLSAQVDDQAQTLPELEDALRQAQHRASQQRTSVTQVQQQIQVLAAEQRHLGEQLRQLGQRHERLQADRRALTRPDMQQLAQLQQQLSAATQAAEAAEARLQDWQTQSPQLDEDRRLRQQVVNAESGVHTALSARLEALRALQERVKTDGKLQPWLTRHGLNQRPALWTRLQVEPGWENALEAALRERLTALELQQLDTAAPLGQDAPPAKLALYQSPPTTPSEAAPAPEPLPPETTALPRLADWLRLHDAQLHALLSTWLHGCHTAPTLDAALQLRSQLQAGQTLYTPAGHAVSRHSINFYAPDSEQAGLLARAHEIEQLGQQLRAQALVTEAARTALHQAETLCTDAAQHLSLARRTASDSRRQAHELQVQTLRLSQQASQAQTRSAELDHDLAELQAQQDELHERRSIAQARVEELDMQLADNQTQQAQLEAQVLRAERLLASSRDQQRSLERQAQEATFAERTLAARQAELSRTLATAAQQSDSLSQDLHRTQTELAQFSDASAQAGLQSLLAVKMEREAQLAALRSHADDLNAQLRTSDARRTKTERELEPLRQRISDLQLKEQAARLALEQYSQLLTEAQADLEAVALSIRSGNVRLHGLQTDIDRLNRSINALGAVNLAALEELGVARERKTFLDAQCTDLTDAMTTLENAIRKIDAETRELLGGTFTTVNEHFGRMFPELFGGGHARLVMTGDEILDAGVQVLAQPPGKKNQTIHLLSGGEKALTAIALVFAIFQLNPAPFCLLDEVDAPLDDANTERYAKLVTRMSRETQFLFISHNKIAMEMAQQLIGVTMQEQGVSRIVAVDMESATHLVQAH